MRSERAPDLKAVRKRAKQRISELNDGKVHVASFTRKQTAAITDALEIIQPFNVGLTDVARQYAEARRLPATRCSAVIRSSVCAL